MKLHKGDFVKMDSSLAVVIATEGDPNVPEEHVAIWFGLPSARISQENSAVDIPEVSTVPLEYCELINDINFIH